MMAERVTDKIEKEMRSLALWRGELPNALLDETAIREIVDRDNVVQLVERNPDAWCVLSVKADSGTQVVLLLPQATRSRVQLQGLLDDAILECFDRFQSARDSEIWALLASRDIADAWGAVWLGSTVRRMRQGDRFKFRISLSTLRDAAMIARGR